MGCSDNSHRKVSTLALCMFAIVGWGTLAPAVEPKSASTAPVPVGSLQEGWEQIDQRLVFLTVQLSTVESSLDAVNKAIRANGNAQSTKQAQAEQARKGNEQMDRNGGGPVPWSQFYGKTAQDFFYHPRGDLVVQVNPAPMDRPPQFDYIYRANAQNQRRAEDEVAKLGNQIDALRARRTELEGEQSALWCRIALRAVSSRDLAEHPLYQFDLTAAKSDQGAQQLAAVKAGAELMRRINRAVEQAQSDLQTDQRAALDELLRDVQTSRATLNDQLNRQPLLARGLGDSHSTLGQFSKCAKRLQDSAQNMVDAYRLASEGDQSDDIGKKNSFRGQLQQMVMDFASSVVTADQLLSKLADEWKIAPDFDKPLSALASKGTSENAVPEEANIAARLERAKNDYTSAVAESRKALLATVDSRLGSAIDAGDLRTVQSLQSAKSSVESGGGIPADVKDSALVAASARYASSMQSANTALAGAYRDAVRDYTRARKLSAAQATQAEFDAIGLATAEKPLANAGDQAGRIYDLAAGLPPFLEPGPPYGVEKDGIRPDEKKYLRTKDADFIDQDFTFDVWFTEETTEGASMWFGLGEGLRNGGGWRPTSSISLHVDEMNQAAGGVALHKEADNGEGLGKLPDTGTYVARIQKTGNAVTFAVGTDHNGTFRADMSKRIDDIRKFGPFLNDHNSHLFFGSNGLFKQVRLVVNGAPRAEVQAPAMPVVVDFTMPSPSAVPAPATSPTLLPIEAPTPTDNDLQAGVYVLAKSLPPFLDPGLAYTVESDGIRLEKGAYLRTRDAHFLEKDFTFDVWFVADTSQDIGAGIGMGEALGNSGSGDLRGIGFGMNRDHEVVLGWQGGSIRKRRDDNIEKMGNVPDTGTFIARIQKQGNVGTFAVGTDHNGTFRADMSQRVDDIRAIVPSLNDHNTHLYFGGNALFKQVRLIVNGQPAQAPASAAPTVVKPATMPSLASSPPSTTAPAVAEIAGPLAPGLTAELFSDTKFEKVAAHRVDADVAFDWKKGASPASGVPAGFFSIRWKGVIEIPASGILGLGIAADDGARLNIDGKDQFEFIKTSQKLVPGPFAPGRHTIQIEYWNRGAAGHARLLWVPTGQIEPQIVPASALFHESPAPEK